MTIFELYKSLCPVEATVSDGPFYLTPKKKPKDNQWFTKNPVGINTSNTCVKRLCKEAGFKSNFTNHLLRASAATRLYQSGIEEQLINSGDDWSSIAGGFEGI